MLFRRDAYEAIGGHEAVKDALLEDLALARRIDAAKAPAGVFVADGLFHCRMYADWAAVPARLEADLHRGGQPQARGALRCGRGGSVGSAPSFPRGCSPPGRWARCIVAHDAARGWTVLALCAGRAAGLARGAGAALRAWRARRCGSAPLHIVGAWLTADLLGEAARDVRSRDADAMGRARVRPPRGQGLILTRAADSPPRVPVPAHVRRHVVHPRARDPRHSGQSPASAKAPPSGREPSGSGPRCPRPRFGPPRSRA